MSTQRYRPVAHAVTAFAVVWLLALAGYRLAQGSHLTSDQVLAYAESVNFASLTGTDRAAALRKLESVLQTQSLDERQEVWSDIMSRWFAVMTETERTQFLAATALPGFKQTPNPFDLLPPERRQQAIDETLKKLREVRNQSLTGDGSAPSANPPAPNSQ